MKVFEFLEKSVTVVCIMSFAGTVLPVLLTGGGVAGTTELESAGASMFFAGIYMLILLLIAVRPSLALRIPVASPAISICLVLAFVSALWSLYPDITLRRSVAFLFTTVFGIYLALRYSFPELMRLMATALSILMLLSFASVFAMPDVGLDHAMHKGAWKGLFFQKNVTGRMMVWLVLCLLWLDWQKEANRWVTRILLVLALLLIVMCRSGTGLLTSGLVAATLFSSRLVRGSIRSFVPTLSLLLAMLVVAATAGAFFWQDALFMLGRDPTLTGRTVLWDHVLTSVEDRPLLGYGYAAYWYGTYGPGAQFVQGWGINSAHNGWLEAMLDLGLPGAVLVAAMLGRLLFQGFFAARYGHNQAEPAWIFATGCAFLAISVSESVFLERHSLNWIVLVIGVVRLIQRSRWARTVRRQAGRHPGYDAHGPGAQIYAHQGASLAGPFSTGFSQVSHNRASYPGRGRSL